MKALWNDTVVADAPKEELVYIEGNWYFPASSVRQDLLEKSDTPYTCPWKGVCQYFNVRVEGQKSKDSAWTYPRPLASAIKTVGEDFSDHVAFWKDVKVVE